jgi:hypothetical protein
MAESLSGSAQPHLAAQFARLLSRRAICMVCLCNRETIQAVRCDRQYERSLCFLTSPISVDSLLGCGTPNARVDVTLGVSTKPFGIPENYFACDREAASAPSCSASLRPKHFRQPSLLIRNINPHRLEASAPTISIFWGRACHNHYALVIVSEYLLIGSCFKDLTRSLGGCSIPIVTEGCYANSNHTFVPHTSRNRSQPPLSDMNKGHEQQ